MPVFKMEFSKCEDFSGAGASAELGLKMEVSAWLHVCLFGPKRTQGEQQPECKKECFPMHHANTCSRCI